MVISKILHNLSQNPLFSLETRQSLCDLEKVNIHLLRQLDDKSVSNNELLIEVCQLTSNWRSLMRENHLEIGKSVHRLRFFHVFENILDRVKLALLEKKLEEVKELKNKTLVDTFIEIGTRVARVSLILLNKAVDYATPLSFQEWIKDTRDQFLDQANQLIGQGDVPLDQVLKWRKEVIFFRTREFTPSR